MSRAVNPYIFAGVGVNGAFNNGEAQDLGPYLPKDNLLWDGSRVFPVGRFGAGMGVRLTDAVHFNIEVNGNFLSDRFNSKKGSAVDWQLGALAGFTFRIGLKKEKPAEVIPVAEPDSARARGGGARTRSLRGGDPRHLLHHRTQRDPRQRDSQARRGHRPAEGEPADHGDRNRTR